MRIVNSSSEFWLSDKYLPPCIEQRKGKRLAASRLKIDGLLEQEQRETTSIESSMDLGKTLIYCSALPLPTGESANGMSGPQHNKCILDQQTGTQPS